MFTTLIMRTLLFIFVIISLLVWLITVSIEKKVESVASVDASSHCTTPTPIPTPIPVWSLYSEWIRMPGTNVGWIRARDFDNVKARLVTLDKVPVMTEDEFFAVGKEYGLRWCCLRGEEQYSFGPVQGFPQPYGGPVIKDEWLPNRLRKR